jgi:hypothetical protein
MARNNRHSSPELNEDLVEIRDPEIETAQIMEQIQERVQNRRADLGQVQQDFPVFGAAAMPGEPEDIPVNVNLYHYLRLVNKSYNLFETGADVQLSPATRVPILGRIWSIVRRRAHELVMFYVNRNIEHQVMVNQQIVSALNLLTASLEEQQRLTLEMQKEIEALRSGNDV